VHSHDENKSLSRSPQQVAGTARAGRRSGGMPLLLLAVATLLSSVLFAGCQFGSSSMAAERPGVDPTKAAAASGDPEKMREAVVAKVRPEVVQVNVATQKGNGLGSGVIIDGRGYIVTNNHVIDGAQKIEVVLFNGVTLPGQLVGAAPNDDLAVVKVDAGKTKLNASTLGDSSKLQVGQDVLAVGNPLGITQTVTNGIISALGRNVSTGQNGATLPGTIQTDAAINPGNSGGALVDMQGNLVGIPTLTAIDPEFKTPANGVGFAIPANRVKFIVPQLINGGKVTSTGRASLDIQVTDIDPASAAQNNLPVNHGVLVVDVTPNGTAASAGLKKGDIIVQVDNKDVTGTASLSDVLLTKNPGDTVPVHVYRGNQQMTVNVKLAELAAP